MLKIDVYNDAVTNWDLQNNQDIKRRAAAMRILHRNNSPSSGSSISKFRSKLFMKDGLIIRISKTFPRNLIYTHKGAGKGRGGSKGSRWVDKYGRQIKTNPKSFGKMGTEGRTAKPFINEALEAPAGVEALATIAAEHLGDILAGNLFIK